MSFSLSAISAQQKPVSIPKKLELSQEKVLAAVHERIGAYYYGLYMNDKKAGYGKTTVSYVPLELTTDVIKIVTVYSWQVKAGFDSWRLAPDADLGCLRCSSSGRLTHRLQSAKTIRPLDNLVLKHVALTVE